MEIGNRNGNKLQSNPSNADTYGTHCKCPDYRGVLISGGEKIINAIPSIHMIRHTDTIETHYGIHNT